MNSSQQDPIDNTFASQKISLIKIYYILKVTNQHIPVGCDTIEGIEYLQRNNNVAKLYHRALSGKYAIRSKNILLVAKSNDDLSKKEHWDQALRSVTNCVNFSSSTCKIEQQTVHIAVPIDVRIFNSCTEELWKYDLSVELKELKKRRPFYSLHNNV